MQVTLSFDKANSSQGIIYDFAGSCYISEDDMAFGKPHKYVYLDPNENEKKCWDMELYRSNEKFRKEEHNICW